MSASHAAVVLAAGGSTRLGRPKQLLTRDSETLVHRAARLALASGASRVLVVVGAHADDIAAAVSDLPVACLVNARWREGLAGSVRLVAKILVNHEGATLLLACDQPALDASHLRALQATAEHAPSGSAATDFDGRVGVPAWLSADILRHARTLPDGDRGLRGILNAGGFHIAACDAPALAHDIDTPDDLAFAIAKGWLDPL